MLFKSTDFASKGLYKDSGCDPETKSRISCLMREKVVNSEQNMAKKPAGSGLFNSSHMNIFVRKSRYGADASISNV